MDSSIIAAMTGVAGIIAGAWLNSRLTLRRERWNLARELYTRLLENLVEVEYVLSTLLEGSGRVEENEETDKIDDTLNDRLSKALDELQRAESIAGILLSQAALAALARLREKRRTARRKTNYVQWLDEEMYAVKDARALVLEAAKKQLGTSAQFRL